MRNWLRLLACLAACATAQADVTRSTESGFTVAHTVDVPLPPPAAWSALSDVGRWWEPSHTYSGDARNMTLEPFVGGCFCEKLGMYAGVQHMTVVFAQPPKTLRLSGALGPLQQFAVIGTWTVTVESAGGGSRISASYTVAGFADRPLSEWAPLVDSVIGSQVQRLGRYISSGNPEADKTDKNFDPKADPRRK
jgi:hypothetical protein